MRIVSEAETFWRQFLHSLTRRGLRGVKLVISDSHEGIEAAASKIVHANLRRRRVHFMRNVCAHAAKSGRRVVSAFMGRPSTRDFRLNLAVEDMDAFVARLVAKGYPS